MKNPLPFRLIAALIAGTACSAAALTNYVGGYDPGGADWLAGSWPNFTNQLADLAASGDELRIAGTITYGGSDTTAYVTSSVAGIRITGGWNSPGAGQPWTRKDLADTNNLSVLDGNLNSPFLLITGNDAWVEGLWFRRGKMPWGGSGACVVAAHNVTLDRCVLSDNGRSYGGYGPALYLSGTNIAVRRTVIERSYASSTASACHLVAGPCTNARVAECRIGEQSPSNAAPNSIYLNVKDNGSLTFDNCVIYDCASPVTFDVGRFGTINSTIYNSSLLFADWGATRIGFSNCVIDASSYALSDTGQSGGQLYFENSLVTNLTWLQSQPFTNASGLQIAVHWDDDGGKSCVEITASNPPCFKNAGEGDFTLLANSPAIDLGDNAYLSATYQGSTLGRTAKQQTDLAGNPRWKRDSVDAGACEWAPPQGTVLTLR